MSLKTRLMIKYKCSLVGKLSREIRLFFYEKNSKKKSIVYYYDNIQLIAKCQKCLKALFYRLKVWQSNTQKMSVKIVKCHYIWQLYKIVKCHTQKWQVVYIKNLCHNLEKEKNKWREKIAKLQLFSLEQLTTI